MPQRHPVATLEDLPQSTGKVFTVNGRRLALFNVEGQIFAIDDSCSHDDASLASIVFGTPTTGTPCFIKSRAIFREPSPPTTISASIPASRTLATTRPKIS